MNSDNLQRALQSWNFNHISLNGGAYCDGGDYYPALRNLVDGVNGEECVTLVLSRNDVDADTVTSCPCSEPRHSRGRSMCISHAAFRQFLSNYSLLMALWTPLVPNHFGTWLEYSYCNFFLDSNFGLINLCNLLGSLLKTCSCFHKFGLRRSASRCSLYLLFGIGGHFDHVITSLVEVFLGCGCFRSRKSPVVNHDIEVVVLFFTFRFGGLLLGSVFGQTPNHQAKPHLCADFHLLGGRNYSEGDSFASV